MDGPDTLPLTLFGASASHAETYFKLEHFTWSLHYNLLLQPTGLAMPDPFFFCPLLHGYLKSENSTWLQAALENDVIIPCVRNANLRSFEAVMRAQTRNIDLDRRGESVSRLGGVDAAIRRHNKFIWPDGMGHRFQKRVEQRILTMPAGQLDSYPRPFQKRYARLKSFFDEDIGSALKNKNPDQGL